MKFPKYEVLNTKLLSILRSIAIDWFFVILVVIYDRFLNVCFTIAYKMFDILLQHVYMYGN